MRVVLLVGWGGMYAIPILKQLFSQQIDIVKIYTQDIHWKKIKKMHPSYYLNYKNNIRSMIEKERTDSIYVVKSVNTNEVTKNIGDGNIDYIFTVGYGEILKKEIISASKFGVINFHPGLLPENQGADPISAVLLNEINPTGATIHFIDEGIDTGNIIIKKELNYEEFESYDSLEIKLGFHTAQMVPELIRRIKAGNVRAEPQNQNLQIYYQKPRDESGLFDFNMTSEQILKIIKSRSHLVDCAYFEIEKRKVHVEQCDVLSNCFGYKSMEIIDQGKGYIIVATLNSAVLLKGINIDNLGKNLSNQLLNEMIGKDLKTLRGGNE